MEIPVVKETLSTLPTRAQRLASLADARHPVAFYGDGIGDSVVSLPTIRALADIYGARLTLVCERTASQLLLGDMPVRRIEVDLFRWMYGGRFDACFDVAAVIERVPRCDVFLSLVPWNAISLMTCVTRLRPDISVGFHPEFDVNIPLEHGTHAMARTFAIVHAVDTSIRLEDYLHPPSLPADALKAAARLRSTLGPRSRVLAVHADTRARKMWPADRFVEVLNRFLERHPDYVAVVVGTTRQPLNVGPQRHRILPSYGLPLDVSAALVAQADAFIGVDSCMLHVADLFRVPGVGLFGPTSTDVWGFRVGPHRHVVGHDASMDQITPDAVLEALDDCLPIGIAPGVAAGERGSTPVWSAFERALTDLRTPSAPQRRSVERSPEAEIIVGCSRVGSRLQTFEAEALDSESIDWSHLLRLAVWHEVLPAVYTGLRPHMVPGPVQDQFRAYYHCNYLYQRSLRKEFDRIADLLGAARIAHTTIDPAFRDERPIAIRHGRQCGGIHLLIGQDDIEAAKRLLESRGYKLRAENPKVLSVTYSMPSHLPQACDAFCLTTRDKRPIFDIRWGLTQWSSVELIAVPDEFTSVNLASISAEDLVIIWALEAAAWRWQRLAWIKDIAEMMEPDAAISWAAFASRVRSWPHGSLAVLGVCVASELLGASLPTEAESLAAEFGVQDVAATIVQGYRTRWNIQGF